MTTIAALATEYRIEAHEVLAGLDITGPTADTADIESTSWTEAEAREVLDLLAEQAANRA